MNNHEIGLHIPEILLPKQGVSLEKWAVVACDQYTAQPEYWERASAYVGTSPSALRVVLPEAYLGEAAERIPDIYRAMDEYCCGDGDSAGGGVLETAVTGFVYLERTLPGKGIRRGLVVAVDLEAYDYEPCSKSLIRATEGTIKDRLPPRARIRENALIESPHIMMLIDDRERTVVEPFGKSKSGMRKLYDFDLIFGAGHLSGWAVEDEFLKRPLQALKALKSPFMYAVGDGNHSLAAAKLCWDTLKKTLPSGERENHPGRYALAELINIHDEGLDFEPIHRALLSADVPETLASLEQVCAQASLAFEYDGERHIVTFKDNALDVLNILQPFLDGLGGGALDYIHGAEALRDLVSPTGRLGFLLGSIDKHGLFPAVEKYGALCKKSFSIGEAHEKRFYMECRRIR